MWYDIGMSGLKQDVVFQHVVKGGTISGGMVKAGYAPSTAQRTDKVTKTKRWQELVAKYISDQKIARLHDKLLNKQEVIALSDGTQHGAHLEWTGQPHSDAVKALEMAYRLKDKYPHDEEGGNKVLILNITGEVGARHVESKDTTGRA